MLYQELPRIESTRLDGGAAGSRRRSSSARRSRRDLLLLLVGQPLIACGVPVRRIGGASARLSRAPASSRRRANRSSSVRIMRWSGRRSALSREPAALTPSEGLAADRQCGLSRALRRIAAAARTRRRRAMRARACSSRSRWPGATAPAASPVSTTAPDQRRSRSSGSALAATCCCGVSRIRRRVDPLTSAVKATQGLTGERLAAAGVLAAVVDAQGKLLAREPAVPRSARCDRSQSEAPRTSPIWSRSAKTSGCG